jgi:integral membrane protein (TIGR01906 family)
MRNKVGSYALGCLISIALFITIIFTCFEWAAFDEGAYWRAQNKYNISAITGLEPKDLREVTHKLLEYTKVRSNSLNMQYPINGKLREVFDGREKAHMVDVQKLFKGGYNIRSVAIIAILLLTTILVSVARKKIYRVLASSWLVTVAVMGAILLVLGIYLFLDFDTAFTQFHRLFFSNDLWQLDPSYEVLIQMLPEEFFFSIVRIIVISSAVSLATVTAVAVAIRRILKNHGDEPAVADAAE